VSVKFLSVRSPSLKIQFLKSVLCQYLFLIHFRFLFRCLRLAHFHSLSSG
jgi:hypothetical protein